MGVVAKPRLFIGSSAEHKDLAFFVQSSLEYDAAPVVWTQGTFDPSHFALESLENALDSVDFAVLICAPDDLTTIRGQQFSTVRDNVIFELGLFIGRLGRKRTFLISPRGADLHLPTDLNGLNPETFDPEQLGNPEAALGPACTKIRSAMRKIGALARPEAQKAQEAEVEAKVQPEPTASLIPSSDWNVGEYEREYLFALFRGSHDDANKIDTAFCASPLAASPEVATVWEAWREVAQMWAGEHGNLGLLRAKAETYPNNARLLELLGEGLTHYGDNAGAADAYLRAAQSATEMKVAARVVREALQLENASSSAATFRSLLLALPKGSYEDNGYFVGAMQSISEGASLHEISKAIAEVNLSFSPDNTTARFELARGYADADQHDLSMLHYETIPTAERSGAAWNNLGVSYANLNIRGKATEAYEASARKGETIALGNLAHKLLKAGFFEEAQKRADDAVSIQGHHESLAGVLTAIQEAKTAEDESLLAAKSKAKEQQAVRLAIGHAALQLSGPDVEGDWATPFGLIQFRSECDGTYSGSGEVVREIAHRGLGFLGIATTQPRLERSKLTIILTRFGNAFEGTVKRESADNPLSLLGSISSEQRLLLQVSEDGSVISGFEFGYETKSVHWRRQDMQLIENKQ